tara:strand:- start:1188 stop:1988 length:801 start_codon:yes stop_codon:yes gene_type:complete
MKIIAEIGWNHMGDMNLAKKMIASASENGADICKFQTWSEKKLKPGPWDKDGRREIYKKAELSKDQHLELKKYCEEKKVKFLTSIFNKDDLNFLHEINPGMIKIGSPEIYNVDLIKSCLLKFDQVIISTGAAKWKEIEKITKLENNKNMVLLHCVSAYPCNAENVNIPRMEELKKYSGEFGYSGHFSGIDDAIIAICNGAKYIEKHFTIDQNLPGRDNKFAIMPNDLKKLSKFRDNFLKMNVNRGLDLQECEMDIFNNARGRWGKN